MCKCKIYSCIGFLLFTLFSGCASNSYNMIVGDDYNEDKNQTEYFVVPFGSVTIPGKWEKADYNTVSNQQFFKKDNGDSIAIAFGPCDKYEFNRNNSYKGWDFIKAYYEWDSLYFVNTHGLNREVIEENRSDNYIIWRVYGEKNGGEFNVYMLFGENNCRVSSYSVQTSTKWPKEKKVSFLKELYLQRD